MTSQLIKQCITHFSIMTKYIQNQWMFNRPFDQMTGGIYLTSVMLMLTLGYNGSMF